ncbi:hypothetical protein [Joostella sp. CR20]|uniref:hypothetical protein n=1 Tax=Joostella sp. CR20 TaxID=2804312 RepID=UPI00313E6A20
MIKNKLKGIFLICVFSLNFQVASAFIDKKDVNPFPEEQKIELEASSTNYSEGNLVLSTSFLDTLITEVKEFITAIGIL